MKNPFLYLILTTLFSCSSATHHSFETRSPSSFNDSQNSCHYKYVCPDGRTAEWGQQRIFSDLMLGELKRIRPGNNVKIAVIDSGFDFDGNAKYMGINFKVDKAMQTAGNPARDEDGHGTAVSGLIGAQNFVGLAPNLDLTTYRVTKTNSVGSDEASIVAGLEKACDDGNEIINLSWGSLRDESGITSAEKRRASVLAKMAEKGCLVVASAGNSSYRIARKDIDNDDNYLRVEALAYSGERAYFSSSGEVIAPGQGVFTLLSTHQLDRPDDSNKCSTLPAQFINGTSFSSPIVAAVAAQVLNVLKMSPQFLKLDGKTRIKIVNKVLIASQIKATHIDALRAVLLAELWTKDGNQVSSGNIAEYLNSKFQAKADGYCKQEAIAACSRSTGCQEKVACLAIARRRLSLCGGENFEHIRDLVKAGFQTGSLELTLQSLRYIDESKLTNPTKLERKTIMRDMWTYVAKQWTENGKYSIRNSIEFDMAIAILPNLFYGGTVGVDSDPDAVLKNFLASSQFINRLSAGKEKGSLEDLLAVQKVIQYAIKRMDLKFTKRAFKEAYQLIIQDSAKSHDGGLNAMIAWHKLLSTLETDPLAIPIVDFIKEIHKNLKNEIVLAKIRSSLPGSAQLEILRSIVAPSSQAIESYRRSVMDKTAYPLENILTLKTLIIASDTTNSTSLDRAQLAVDLIERLMSSELGEREMTLFDYVENVLEKSLTDMRLTPNEKDILLEKYWSLVRRSNKASFRAGVLSGTDSSGALAPETWGKIHLERESPEAFKLWLNLSADEWNKNAFYLNSQLFGSAKHAAASEEGKVVLLKLFKVLHTQWRALAQTSGLKYFTKYYGQCVLTFIESKSLSALLETRVEALAELNEIKKEIESDLYGDIGISLKDDILEQLKIRFNI
jgi:hypothetical protein